MYLEETRSHLPQYLQIHQITARSCGYCYAANKSRMQPISSAWTISFGRLIWERDQKHLPQNTSSAQKRQFSYVMRDINWIAWESMGGGIFPRPEFFTVKIWAGELSPGQRYFRRENMGRGIFPRSEFFAMKQWAGAFSPGRSFSP